MFGLFPSSWILPRIKPSKYLGDHHFPKKTLKISAPVPEAAKAKVINAIPECEMCIGEQNDFSQIDLMLEDIYDDSPDAKTRQILRTMSLVNDNLTKNIKVIEGAPAEENSNVSNGDVLKLLRLFANYSRNLENYIKEEIKPSSLSFSQY